MLIKKIGGTRIVLMLTITTILFFQRQFEAEAMYKMNWFFYDLTHSNFLKPVVQWLTDTTGINFFNYWYYTKPIYVSPRFIGIFLFVSLFYNSKNHLRMAGIIIGGWIACAFLMNFGGKVIGVERLTSLGRSMTDMILSPFTVAFIIPVLMLVPHLESERNKIYKNL